MFAFLIHSQNTFLSLSLTLSVGDVIPGDVYSSTGQMVVLYETDIGFTSEVEGKERKRKRKRGEGRRERERERGSEGARERGKERMNRGKKERN